MMKALLAAVSLMTLGQAALAAETATPPATAPFVLDDDQMDQVRGGGGGSRTYTAIEGRHPGLDTGDPVKVSGARPGQSAGTQN